MVWQIWSNLKARKKRALANREVNRKANAVGTRSRHEQGARLRVFTKKTEMSRGVV